MGSLSVGIVLGGVLMVGSAVSATEVTSTSFVVTSAPTVTAPALSISGQRFSAIIGQPVQVSLEATGGMRPYRYQIIANGLPEGVFFDTSESRLLGSAGRTGNFPFTIRVEDAQGTVFDRSFWLDVRLATETSISFGDTTPLTIDLNNISEHQLEALVDTFADDAPLIYVGPNAPESILKINIAQMRIKPQGLYRVEGGTPSTVNESHKHSDVYYVDQNGRRHAFPTDDVFKSWYKEEPVIEAVPDWKLSNIPLRKNVTFRPGTIVRLENTREFYRVMPQRTLKKFQDEATYQQLAPTIKQSVVAPMYELVSVLPLANVADYQFDPMTIKSISDLPTISQIPVYPSQEM